VPQARGVTDAVARAAERRGELAADLKTEASTRTVPADDWVLGMITAHVDRYGTGLDGVIITNRVGRVARRNSFGYCWRAAVASARICGNPPAGPEPGGQCGEQACANPAHCLPKGTRFHDLRHFYASTLKRRGVASDATFRVRCEEVPARVLVLPQVCVLFGPAARRAEFSRVPVLVLRRVTGCGIRFCCAG
jgi:hypothetical protein